MLTVIKMVCLLLFISFLSSACSNGTKDGTNLVGITHNGIVYETVTSPYTARVWLDRNLGASQVCTSFDDRACYGNYYQWGRDSDGHESNTSEANTTLAIDVNNAGDDFIVSANPPYDWTISDTNGSIRSLNWSKIDASSVCPIDYRVPTIDELRAETLDSVDGMSNRDDAFDNFLKLPSSGYRFQGNGLVNSQDSQANIWSSSAGAEESQYMYFYSSGADTDYNERSGGLSIRCIKDVIIISDAGADQHSYEAEIITLDALKSSSDDGNIVSYKWMEEDTVLSTDSSFSKSDFAVGVHIIILTVRDDNGDIAMDSITVTVSEPRETIAHNNVSYYTIASPYTAKVWLDRNLGASQACTTFDDSLCYGDYYEWGRGSDGHEKIDANITSTLISDLNNTSGDYIYPLGSPYDWTTIDSNGSIRSLNWSKIDASSVCPIDYRVPTNDELNAETLGSVDEMSNNEDAFNNFLKLPSVGYRNRGNVYAQGSKGGLWTSNISDSDETRSDYLFFDSSNTYIVRTYRSYAYPIRCIKD